jgi:predicted ester cyclase
MVSHTQYPTVTEALVRDVFDAVWGPDGGPGAIDDYFATDFVDHEPGRTIEGPDAYREYVRDLLSGMLDFEGATELVVCDGDYVSVRYTVTGTHVGTFWGIEPTREQVEISGNVVYHATDGRIVERWNAYDRLELFDQLGVDPGAATY